MKKPFIILGVSALAILFALGGLVTYITVVKKEPISSVMQNPFATSGTRDIPLALNTPPDATAGASTTPVAASALFELATRATAAAVMFERDGDTFVRYAERGTGYIYEISLSTRKEIRVSNTTLGKVTDAVFSPSGTRAAITHVADTGLEILLGTIDKNDKGDSSFVGLPLPPNAHSPGFDSTGELFFYAVTTTSGTTGYSRDLKTGKEKAVFTTPLRAVSIVWTPRTIIATKPSYDLLGAAYLKNGDRVASGRGLMVKNSSFSTSTLAFSITNSGIHSAVLDGAKSTTLAELSVPEKCDFESTSSLICAVPKEQVSNEFPDTWLMGVLKTNDQIVRINTKTDVASPLINLESAVGRMIDVVNMHVYGTKALFINKRDGTLWTITLN